MDLPLEAYRDCLHSETTAIAEGNRDPAEFVPVLYMSTDSPTNPDWALVRSTNVHMIPGVVSPRLRKTDLPHPEIPFPAALEDEVVKGCLGPLKDKQPDFPYAVVDNVARAVIEVCEGMDNEPGLIATPFKTLGVLGIYVTELRTPLIRGYLSTTFLLDMSARISPDAVAGVEAQGETRDVRGNIAVAALAMLLPPRELTHPRIQQLFES